MKSLLVAVAFSCAFATFVIAQQRASTPADSEQSQVAAAIFHRNLETDGIGARRRQRCAHERESRTEAVRPHSKTDSNRTDNTKHTSGSSELVDRYLQWTGGGNPRAGFGV